MSCEVFDSVNALQSFCMAYRTATKDGASAQYGRDHMATIAGVDEDDVTAVSDDVTVATASRRSYTKPKPAAGSSCGYCGKNHTVRRSRCPASGSECNYCGKLGHFEMVCKLKAQSRSKLVTGAVIVAASCQITQPTV